VNLEEGLFEVFIPLKKEGSNPGYKNKAI